MARIKWAPPPPPPEQLPPKAWRRLTEGDLWTDDDGHYLVTGYPAQEDEDHHCDEMGCGSAGPHILMRLRRVSP
jgi:hypothetical protein